MTNPLPPLPDGPPRPLNSQESYNLITDTVAGANLRFSDNLIQAAAIGASVLLLGGLGALVAWRQDAHPVAGLLVGALAGLVVGLFASGIFLMIYRGLRHARGKHD